MFGWLKGRNSEPRSVLDLHTEVDGPLRSAGFMEIRGLVTGDIEHAGTLVIAPGGCCLGGIRATHLRIAGEVHGDVTAETLQICGGGRLLGDADCSKLVVESGGTFVGRNRVGESGEPPLEAQPTRPPAVTPTWAEERKVEVPPRAEAQPKVKVEHKAEAKPADAAEPAETITFSGYPRRR